MSPCPCAESLSPLAYTFLLASLVALILILRWVRLPETRLQWAVFWACWGDAMERRKRRLQAARGRRKPTRGKFLEAEVPAGFSPEQIR